MLAKVYFFVAFATLGMVMPQRGNNDNNNNRDAQQTRVEDLRNKGLTCNDRGDGIFVCDDGLGGNLSVQVSLDWLRLD
ncbi:hypothetical protein FSST1_008643 [Fusarium sambucinum]